MKIVRIIERPTSPNERGEWVVYAQLMRGGVYQYGALLYKSLKDAMRAREGEHVDAVRVKFSRRTNNGVL